MSDSSSATQSSPASYRLYDMKWCPYCRMVRQEAQVLGIPLELIDVTRDASAHAHLVENLGRGTVPVLGIVTDAGEQLLPESRDIVRYLRQNAL